MQYVDGPDASELPRTRGRMPPDLVSTIVAGVGSALDYAYAEFGVTHRDVKPANILVRLRDGATPEVRLADFGIAKSIGAATSLTSTGTALGTVGYMAPEAVAQDRPVDQRADVYALGCTAFELLTGGPPYRGDNPPAVMLAHLNSPIPTVSEHRTGLPAALDAVFTRVLAKDPDDRYSTNLEFASALAGALRSRPLDRTAVSARTAVAERPADEPTVVREPLPAPRPRRAGRSVVLGAAAVAAVVLGYVAVYLEFRSEMTPGGLARVLNEQIPYYAYVYRDVGPGRIVRGILTVAAGLAIIVSTDDAVRRRRPLVALAVVLGLLFELTAMIPPDVYLSGSALDTAIDVIRYSSPALQVTAFTAAWCLARRRSSATLIAAAVAGIALALVSNQVGFDVIAVPVTLVAGCWLAVGIDRTIGPG